mmetsp:Transcript_117205/g.343295  ORF Transcript_117205/g.343295 Transcript_117205/m.343295 type:complete len:669 (+) Transcript_117205:63-2069(+)
MAPASRASLSLALFVITHVLELGAASRSFTRTGLLSVNAKKQPGSQGGGPRQLEAHTLRGVGRNSTAPQPHLLAPSSSFLQAEASSLTSSRELSLGRPDEVTACLLAAVAAVLVSWTYGPSATRIFEKRAKVREELAELEQNYMVSAGQLEEKLEGMEECSALLAERNFEGKARSFRRFMDELRQDLAKDPRSFGNKPPGLLFEPLRHFAQHWLRAFEHCSPRPRVRALKIASEEELAACRDIPQLAVLLCQRLERCTVNLLGKSMGKAKSMLSQKLKSSSVEDAESAEKPWHSACTWLRLSPCSGFGWSSTSTDADIYPLEIRLGFCSASLLSNTHVALVCAFLTCVLLLIVEACLAKLVIAALLLVTAGGFVAAGLRIEFVDSLADAEKKLLELQKASGEMAEVAEVIHHFHEHREEVTELWRLHTEPRLEYLEELFERFGDAPAEQRPEFLQACNASLDEVLHGMGPVSAWVGDEMCSLRARDLGCRQLRAHADSIAAAQMDGSATDWIQQRLQQPIFGLLVVRVHAASGLRNADFSIMGGGKPDPYVTVAIGQQEVRTHSVQDSRSPVWDSEPFPFELCGRDRILELRVWDEDANSKDELLGQTQLDIRQHAALLHGSWREQRAPLKTGKEQAANGELIFEFYYAEAVPEMEWETTETTPVLNS